MLREQLKGLLQVIMKQNNDNKGTVTKKISNKETFFKWCTSYI